MMQRALEGDCEPIFYMGVPVGYVRKYDTRLQIEMARALMPAVFKTPGTALAVQIRDNRSLFIMDSETLAELQQIRREQTLADRAKLARATELPDSSAPTAPAQNP
jgi:hypothetical protein